MPTEPRWMATARSLVGVTEAPGSKDNPTIIGWAKKIGGWIASFYRKDSVAWCGLFVDYVFLANGIKGPDSALGALNWSPWGTGLQTPWLGAVMTFKRPGGGHVGFYVGEDDTAYHILGGNQANAVKVSRVDKKRLVAIRWPAGEKLGPVGRVYLKPNGSPLSRNEA